MAATYIEVASDADTITFHATPDITGYVYDNETLEYWYALAEVETNLDKRPNAHGAFPLGTVYLQEHRPLLVGQFYGSTSLDALLARERLSALFNSGQTVTLRVVDELRATSRTVQLVNFEAPFRHGFEWFPFDLAFVATDPRRYDATIVVGPEALPASGTGLVWDLGTAGSGLFFDWGTVGTLGQVAFTNTGITETYPRIEVGGGGAFLGGFYVTEIETGRSLRYERATYPGEVVVFDSRTQRATLNGADVTGGLSRREWFTVPSGATRRYQINSIGSTSGAVAITLYAAPAYL